MLLWHFGGTPTSSQPKYHPGVPSKPTKPGSGQTPASNASQSPAAGTTRPGGSAAGTEPPRPQPIVLKGLNVSPGIVIARVYLLQDDPKRVSKRSIAPETVKQELARFDAALKGSIGELQEVHRQAEKEMGKDAAKIFLFHIGMLGDKSLVSPIRKLIETDRVNAEYAVASTLGALAATFRSKSDSVFATKVNDIDDLAARLLSALTGGEDDKLKNLDHEVILVGKDLTPSQCAAFDRKKILGFATDLGGRTSHTAIVARALGLPAVVGCERVSEALAESGADWTLAILDGDHGEVILHPSEAQVTNVLNYLQSKKNYEITLNELRDLPAVTLDGVPIELLGNIEFAEEITSVINSGGVGVGLYRTEFLVLTRSTEPTEGDHFNAYKRCLDLAEGRPITIRTLDLGADKYTQSRTEVPERNPFLGLRSIRFCLKNQHIFKRQLRALLRASGLPTCKPGQMKIMFPLITSTSEFRQAKYLLNDMMEDLADEGQPFDSKIKVGMMVEVPSAALMADTFAQEADFFSIGTNDLVQYTLAVDRTNERVANLYNPFHPAVIMLIRDVARVAKRRNIPLSCCGESAADLEFALILLGLGLRTLSSTASTIPHLKRLVRSVRIEQCQRLAKQALSLDNDAQVAALMRERARKIVPEAFEGRLGE